MTLVMNMSVFTSLVRGDDASVSKAVGAKAPAHVRHYILNVLIIGA